MTILAVPTVLVPSACSFKLSVNDRVNAAGNGGSEQAVDLLNERWLVELSQDVIDFNDAADIEGWIAAMRGRVNTVQLYHYARPAPRGTARGTILTNGVIAQGAAALTIDGITPTNGTFKIGDMLGIGSQLFMVSENVTASGGAATVPVANRVRAAIPNNTTVVWDKPKVEVRLLSTNGVVYSGATVDPISLSFGEKL